MHNKKFPFIVAIFAAAIAVFSAANFARAADSCNDHVVISQIYGGGGNKDALYRNDFIELYNPTDKDISLENWSVQYASISGSFTKATMLSGNIESKKYYLIKEGSGGSSGIDFSNFKVEGTMGLSAADGKIALVKSTESIPAGTNLLTDSLIVDIVTYGDGSSTKSIYRDIYSCPNTFSTNIPNPQNSSIVENDNTQDEIENTVIIDYPKNIVISEIFPYPSTGKEFVELYNPNGSPVDLSEWTLLDKNLEDGSDVGKKIGLTIEAKSYLKISQDIFGFSINNTSGETVILKNPNKKEINRVSYLGNAKKNYSYALSEGEFLWTSTPTPGAENVFDAPEDEAAGNSDVDSANVNATASEKVYLNEILPNPKDDEEKDEFIEIVNGDNGPVDLFGWTIRDGSKSGKYVFKEHTEIASGEYLAIYRSQFKIALNNSAESVSLYNPQGELTSSVSYDKSLENTSYSFDGKIWKWSKYLTPGKKNKFDSQPSVKVSKPKNAYKDLYTEFSAKAKDKETKDLKYTWDFGDGKKSYLAKTSHKYLATGKYAVTLSVSDDSQTVEKSFSLQVKKYPRPDLELVKVVPNPAGNDSEGEIVKIKNNSSKKIDLADWKIATGSGEKMYNHPISGEFTLDANETKTITREFSKFSLNNKAGKVQLVMPDEKVVDEVEYSKEKIADDEAYTKIDGEWQWIEPGAQDENTDESDTTEDDTAASDQNNDENADNGEVLGATNENTPVSPSFDSHFTSEDAYIFLSDIGFFKSQIKEINYCPLKNTTASLEYYLVSSI